MLLTIIFKRESKMVGHLLRDSSWFTNLLQSMLKKWRVTKSPRQEYIDEIEVGNLKKVKRHKFKKGFLLNGRRCRHATVRVQERK